MCLLCRTTRKKETSRARNIVKKSEISEYNKSYYLNNKSDILKSKETYKKENRDAILSYAREYQKVYRANNKDKVLTSDKKYRLNNKDKKKKYDRAYWLKNKSKRLVQVAENHRSRMKIDPAYKLRCVISISIGVALKKAGSSKNGFSITKHLLYTIQELKDHLEQQFEPWMSWNNYGVY